MIRAAITLAVALAFVFAAARLDSAPRAEAGAPEPDAVVEQLLTAISEGNVDAALALVADDVVLIETSQALGGFSIHGKPAFEVAITDIGAEITIRDIQADGNVVTGSYEWSDDVTIEATVDRYVEDFIVNVSSSGLVTNIRLAYDESDAETQQYLDFVRAQEDAEEDGDFAADLEAALSPGEGDDQEGTAAIFEADSGVIFAGVLLETFPTGTQPVSIRAGTCATPGAVITQLGPALNGQLIALASTDISALSGDVIVVVQESESNTAVAACGAVLGAAAAPEPAAPPPAPAAPAAPAPAPQPIVAPDTGTGGAAAAATVPSWLFALGFAGMMLTGAGLAARRW
jgi:hypothetical protein